MPDREPVIDMSYWELREKRRKENRERVKSGWTSLRVSKLTRAALEKLKERSRAHCGYDKFLFSLIVRESARLDDVDAAAAAASGAKKKAGHK